MELRHYPCPVKTRHYEIEAIQIPIVYNKYGDHDPDGLLYVLKKDAERIKQKATHLFEQEIPQPCEEVVPLVIRGNVGEKIVVTFSHSLNRELSIHVQGMNYDVQTSDGTNVGYNKNSTTKHRITYTWYACQEGVFLFHDMGDSTGNENGTNIHGLFGAIIIEAPESTWLNPETGKELESGLFADIYHPSKPSFREYAVFFHDELEIKDKDGMPPMDHHTGLPSSKTAISYRSEPMRNRHPLTDTPIPPLCPLKDRAVPPKKDSLHPGYPNFINGTFGEPPLQPPLGVENPDGTNKIGPTELKEANFVERYEPGALYTDTCPCGTDCNLKVFELALVQAKVTYNRYGWHDPRGRFFVLKQELERHGGLDAYIEKVETGKLPVEPLVIRANAGDWIEITLHNLFDVDRPIPYFDSPTVPLDYAHKPSMRVSLNPQFLNYDPVNDSGINVGYNNREQTVGVGESKKYLWYADKEYDPCIIQSFDDMRNHRYHGLFGVIIIEPVGAKWFKSSSLCKAVYDESAVITAPGMESFRECVVLIQNGIRMLDKENRLVRTTSGEEWEEVDPEDTGEKGYNYRSERFANRLKKNSKISVIFNSRIHGDPATPVFKVYSGERVIFRTVMPADKPRNVGFCIHGHTFKKQPKDPLSNLIATQGGISIGNAFSMELKDGAAAPGDYLYRSGSFKWDVESGMWGILRVLRQGIFCKCRNLYQSCCCAWKKEQ